MGEVGINGVKVTLTINYPNGTVTTLVKLTGDNPATPATEQGWYAFGNLLLDEDFDGVGTFGVGPTEPSHSLSVVTPLSYTASPQNATTEDLDSDNPAGEVAFPVESVFDSTFDFGFTTLSLGNRIWADADNSGTINGVEGGLANVTVQVFLADGAGNPTGLPLGTMLSDANGYYRFDGLAPGNYVVVVPAVNFANGQPLFGLLSSGTGLGTFNGVGPDLDPTDSNDNGTNPHSPGLTGVRSAAVTLAYGTEPGGTDLGPGDSNSSSANLTVDFGFAQPVPTRIRLAYVKGWSAKGQVTVEWATVSELNTVGFELYRLGTDGSRVLVGDGLIAAVNNVGGGVYRVMDGDLPIPSRQRYVLVELENTGKENTYGPFEVDVRAAAVVSGVRLTHAGIEVSFTGQPGAEFEVESTDDLQGGRWVSAGRVRADEAGRILFRDALTNSMRFYRALQP